VALSSVGDVIAPRAAVAPRERDRERASRGEARLDDDDDARVRARWVGAREAADASEADASDDMAGAGA